MAFEQLIFEAIQIFFLTIVLTMHEALKTNEQIYIDPR